MATTETKVIEHIAKHPGCTELEIARALFGPAAIQQQVNGVIRRLVSAGTIVRDLYSRPYTYSAGTNAYRSAPEGAFARSTDQSAQATGEIKPKSASGSVQHSGLDLLRHLGFDDVGVWRLMGNALTFELAGGTNGREILYAFICDDRVLYLGKSVHSLAHRMQHYKTPGPSQRTNIANNQRIRDLLAARKTVRIWAATRLDPIAYRGVPMNTAAGLEDPLIRRLAPPWNGSTKLV